MQFRKHRNLQDVREFDGLMDFIILSTPLRKWLAMSNYWRLLKPASQQTIIIYIQTTYIQTIYIQTIYKTWQSQKKLTHGVMFGGCHESMFSVEASWSLWTEDSIYNNYCIIYVCIISILAMKINPSLINAKNVEIHEWNKYETPLNHGTPPPPQKT
jgi:hypothetical protein